MTKLIRLCNSFLFFGSILTGLSFGFLVGTFNFYAVLWTLVPGLLCWLIALVFYLENERKEKHLDRLERSCEYSEKYRGDRDKLIDNVDYLKGQRNATKSP